MRDFPLPFTVLALFPGAWSFFTLEHYLRNGADHLLLSSMLALLITIGFVLLDVLFVVLEYRRNQRAHVRRQRLKASVRERKGYGHHLRQKD